MWYMESSGAHTRSRCSTSTQWHYWRDRAIAENRQEHLQWIATSRQSYKLPPAGRSQVSKYEGVKSLCIPQRTHEPHVQACQIHRRTTVSIYSYARSEDSLASVGWSTDLSVFTWVSTSATTRKWLSRLARQPRLLARIMSFFSARFGKIVDCWPRDFKSNIKTVFSPSLGR